ncbi:MAG: gliding motility-associated C-terminal domain-containing protein [Bacteroidales bacterium]|nr:gliding motility-associated C-terminal domain-containing protein [Bacteroidales bacterium]
MNRYKHLIVALLFTALAVVCRPGVQAQSWNMVASDTVYIDGCTFTSGTIYDNGGPNGNYTNNFSGWVVINTLPGVTISLSGSYVTESSTYDWIDVWDGDVNTGTQLVYRAGGTGTLAAVSATSGRMTVYFRSDGGVYRSGFELHYNISGGSQLMGLTATSVSDTSATVQWNSSESGPFHVLLDGVEIDTTMVQEYTFGGLSGARQYSVLVYPDGQEGNYCSYGSITFRTACGVTHSPLVEMFDDLTSEVMPPCWTKSTNFDNVETQPRLMDVGEGNLALMVSCGSNNTGSHYGMVIAPVVTNAGTQWIVSFDYRASHNGTQIEIGVCDTTSTELQYYGFTSLDNLYISDNSQWVHYRQVLTIPSSKCRLAFRMVQSSQSGVGRMVYLDNFAVENCGINEVWLTQTDTTSVKVNWTEVSTPTVNIGVRLEGTLVDDTVIMSVTSPYVVSGLLPDSRYMLTLYPVCDGRSQVSSSVTVQTMPSVGLRTSLCENPLDYVNYSYVLRDDWTVRNGSYSTSWYNSRYYITMYNSDYLITPPIGNLGGNDVYVSYYTGSWYASQMKIVVGTVSYADDFSTFMPIDTIDNIQSGVWQNQVLHIPTSCTDRFVAFYCMTAGASLVIGDVSIGNCMVSNARVTQVHHNNVSLAWDTPSALGDTVIVAYRYSSVFYYDTVVGVNQHTVTGLNSNKDITFRLLRPCGEACALRDLVVHTPRPPLPLCENFDGSYSTLFPSSLSTAMYGWYRPSTYGGCPDTSLRYSHSGLRSLKLETYYGYRQALPYIDSVAGKVLTFWARSIAPSSAVKVSSMHLTRINDSYNTLTYQEVKTIPLNGDGMWHHYGVTLPDTLTQRVALNYQLTSGSGSYVMWLDDLQMGACGYGNFAFANLTSHSVDVVWERLGATASRIRLEGTNGQTIDTIALQDTVHFVGLDSNVVYRCYMAPILGTDTLCLSYAGRVYTPMYGMLGGGIGINFEEVALCNPMEVNDTLPKGWIFSDSTAIQVTGGTMRVAPGMTADTILLPSIQAEALYLAARGLSGSDTLFVDGDTTVLDTIWRHYCYEPDPTWGHRVALRIVTGSATGGCELDDVGFSSCPIIDFTPDGNTIRCHVRNVMTPELILTLTDEDAVEHNYYITTPNYTIDGLKPSTTYTARWHCLYMSDGCMPTLEVRTAAIPVPYCVDFSSGNNTSLPDGWKVIGRSSDNAQSYSNNQFRFYSSYNYSYSPQYHVYNTHWQYIILPETEEKDNLTVTIYGSMGNTNQQMEIGVLTNPNDTSTFVTAGSIVYQDASPYVVDLSQLPHGRVAIRNMAGYLYINRIQLFDAPMISSTHLYRYDTLTINTSSVGDYELKYEFRSSNYSSFSYPTTVMVDTPSYNLPLQGFSYYGNRYLIFQQTNVDGTTGCFSQPTNIPLHKTQSVPYCENFTSYSSYYYGFFGVYNNQSSVWSSSSNYNSETQSYEYTLGMGVSSDLTFSLPYMLIDSVKNLVVGFKYRYDNNSSYPSNESDLLVAGVLTDALDSSSFTPTDSIEMIMDGEWHMATVDYATYQGEGRWIALRDVYNVNNHTLYLDDIHIEGCQGALRATATLERYNVVRIDNTKNERFYVEYGPLGFARGSGTLTAIDTTPYHLTLTPETEYEFYFYCDSVGAPCAKSQMITTLAPPLTVPVCIDFDTNTVGLEPRYWNMVVGSTVVSDSVSHGGDNSLMVLGTVATPDIDVDSLQEISIGLWVMTTEANTRLMVGAMTNPHDPITFHNLKTIVPEHTGVWEHHFVSFAEAPDNAHFVALRNSSGNSRTLFVDDIHVTDCAAFDMRVNGLDNNNISLSWSEVGTPSVTFTVEDNGVISNYTPVADSIILPITPLHSYTIAMHSECSSTLACNVDYDDTLHIIAPVEGVGCVNPTDLHSPQAVFFSGSYENPYAQAGAVDRGSRSPDSRHTVCYDTTERDPRTGGLLRTIPEGYTSSVRLGNWNTNYTAPDAEGVIYSLFIDTMNFNLLMMRYAAVLQDPMHDATDQPRFRLELLDSAYNLIDPVCAAADFIANHSLGWNEASDNVLWKDWTPVGIDVSAYAGQQVYVRLTTYDCNEGSHYGYAYFTLECMRKTIDAETCGNVDSNRFTAPAGFNYRWYTADSPTTISTERTLVVPTANMATYYCDLSFVGNASCSFTLSAFGGPRLPLARVDTTVTITDCHFDVQFTNRSTVSPDGINPAPTNEQVESAYWDFGNGETSNSYHGHTVYDTIGTYTVTLIVGISGGDCTDTLVWPMRVEQPTLPYIVGPDSLCDGAIDTLRLYGGIPYNDTLWTNGGDYWYLPLSQANYQLGSNVYSLITTDPYGCMPPVSHTLTVSPVYQFTDSVRICNPLLPYSYRDTLFLEGTMTGDFDFYHLSMAGCDSNYHLWLSVNDTSAGTFRDTVNASICDNESYSFCDTLYAVAGIYSLAHVDATGACDSIHTLQLEVRATSTADTVANHCDSFVWYDSTYTLSTETPTHIIPNTVGCDSTTTLHLIVRYSSSSTYYDTVLENQLPRTFNSVVFVSDTLNAIVTIPNNVVCDSMINYSLKVHWNSLVDVDSTICADKLPLSWNSVIFTAAGVLSDTLTGKNGEDSVVRMTLYVNPVYDDTIVMSICDNQSYLFADSNYAIAGTYTRLLTTAKGCDSLCTLDLSVRLTTMGDTVATVCDSIVWHGNTYYTSDDSLMAPVGLNVVNCDSTLHLTLTVNYSQETNDSIYICPGYPFLYRGIDYGSPTAFDALLETRQNCDSLVHVTLLARDSNYRLLPLYRFDTTDWQMPDSVLKGCDPTVLYLRDSTDGAAAWNWTVFMPDTLQGSTDSMFSISFDKGQDAMMAYISLIVTDTLGCYDTVGWPLFVFESSVPEFQWHPDVPAMHNPEAQFENLTWPDTSNYLWRIQQQEGGAFDTTTVAEPFYHWGEPSDNMVGDYTVRLIASWPHTVNSFRVDTVQWIDSTLRSVGFYEAFTHTCVDSVEHTVTITNDFLEFPNLVSPNGDGINDTWVIVNLIEFGNYSLNELWIYDRTGAQVYHVKNIRHANQFWDPNATRSPDGTYYYRFTAKGEYGLVKRNGLIEVLRK